MRDYGRIHSTFWSSQTTASLSDDGKLLAVYLLTCSHNTIAGVFRLPDGYVAEDIGWSPERVSEGFAELFRNGFANRCAATKWVWITKHFKWNPLDNPNQRKAAAKVAKSIPAECSWKLDFMRVCGHELGLDQPESGNPSETVSKPFRNQEQEQEQEQEKKRRATRLTADWQPTPDELRWARDARPDIDASAEVERFRDYWIAKAGKDGAKLDWTATWRNWIRGVHARPTTAASVPVRVIRPPEKELFVG